MSGHSKWHTIQKRKGAADSQRAAQFTKVAKLITVAARLGGGDPTFNFQLRVAIDQAKAVNMPKENIERAIKRGAGTDGTSAIEEILYEGFGPAGVAVIVKCLTDNRNRSVAEVRHAMSKHGGTMGNAGAVLWMFEKKSVVSIARASITHRDAFELAMIDAGAEDMEELDEHLLVIAPADALKTIVDAVERQELIAASAALVWRPKESVVLHDADQRAQFETFFAALDELEDVDEIFTNAQ